MFSETLYWGPRSNFYVKYEALFIRCIRYFYAVLGQPGGFTTRYTVAGRLYDVLRYSAFRELLVIYHSYA